MIGALLFFPFNREIASLRTYSKGTAVRFALSHLTCWSQHVCLSFQISQTRHEGTTSPSTAGSPPSDPRGSAPPVRQEAQSGDVIRSKHLKQEASWPTFWQYSPWRSSHRWPKSQRRWVRCDWQHKFLLSEVYSLCRQDKTPLMSLNDQILVYKI